MAILEAVPGLSVFVCIDEKKIEEYVDDEVLGVPDTDMVKYQAARTVRKYIEAISGKEFSFLIRLDKSYAMDCLALTIRYQIDGKNISKYHITASEEPAYFKGTKVIKPYSITRYGVHVACPGRPDKQYSKKFTFGNIVTTQFRDAKKLEDVGEFIVSLYRASEKPVVPRRSRASDHTKQELKVHEKALKGQAKTHSTLLGPASKLSTRHLKSKSYEPLDGAEHPLAVFRFKYRSKEALQSLLILPRTPSPGPQPEALVDLRNLDADRRAQVERFLRTLNAGENGSAPAQTIKRERDQDEHGEGSRKMRNSGEKVMIDLTSDSDCESIVALN